MFGYRSNVPKVRLTTDRLVVRLVHERDAASGGLLRRESPVLKPQEPVRDESHCYPSGWQARLSMIAEFHKQGSAFYFALLDPEEKEIVGIANFQTWYADRFTPAISGIPSARNGRDRGSCLRR